ncbi:hypothetical protein [Candidatus Nitrosotalea bavarica]|uniref:hypothetical protein n=1 Tax=Candidatus Nitrosotalea bavarica TaxID=1903277 RepID=UPI000C70A4A4|nr:hypothetical protein [Candidatus Nitrosotalea bavarica]
MIGKLIIIGIIAVTLIILIPNSSKIFQTEPALKTVKEKIDNITSNPYVVNASKSAEIKAISVGEKLVNANSTGTSTSTNSSSLNNNTPTTVNQLPSQYVNQQNYTGQVFEKTGDTCEISVPEMAQVINGQTELTHIIQFGQCSLNVGDPVQVTTLTAKPDAPAVNPSSGLQITPYSKVAGTSLPTLPNYYNVVQLTTTNQGNNTMLNFDDSSGQTKSVIVTMRNNSTILFTGTFYSSKFTTEVKDVPNTPHLIEMTIDNAIYGTLHASAYAPSNAQNSTMTGILSQ